MTNLYSNFPAMKKNVLFIAAFCAAALVSCTPKELVIEEPETIDNPKETTELIHITIKASMSESTKATISTDRTWTWEASDKLAVFDGTTVTREFSIKEILSDGQAIFDGYVASTEGLKAVFPYSAALSDGSYKLSSSQTISTGQTVDPAAMVATATGEKASGTDFTFYFTPAVSFFKLTVGAGVDKVVLHCVKKEDTIAGDSRSLSVTVPGEGTYWVPINALSYTGIRAFVHSSDGWTLKAADGATINLSKPGSGKNLGTVSGGTAVSVIEDADNLISYLKSTPTPDGYIVNDIDLTSKTINTCSSFAKTFDGQYHSINNWTSNGVTMFATVTGCVKNFIIDRSCSFTAPSAGNFGAAVSVLSGGTISGITNKANIICSGDLSAQRCLGGIVGRLEVKTSLVDDCHNIGNITSSFSPTSAKKTLYTGGIVGAFIAPSTNVRISNCTNSGIIKVEGSTDSPSDAFLRNNYVGGIFGGTGVNAGDTDNKVYENYTKNYGTIHNCHNSGKVEVTWTGGTGGYFRVGGIGGYAEAAFDDCFNEGDVSYSNSTTISNAGPAIGGICGAIAGTASIIAKDCKNTGTISLTGRFSNAATHEVKVDDTTTVEYALNNGLVGCKYPTIAGCFGTIGDNANSIQGCINEGDISIQLAPESALTYSGGIAGFSSNGLNNCKNYGDISFDGGGMNKQVYLSGIVALLKNKSTIDGCTNEGNITASNWSNTSFSYLGGVMGSYDATKSTIKNCHNSGKMKSTGASKIRIGGIAAALYGNMDNCINTGDIEASNALAGSRFGGLMGYSSAPVAGGSSDCTITVTGNNATGHAGLLCGDIARSNIISGVSVGGTIITDTNVKSGILFGGYNSTKNVAKYTLGATDAPLIIKATANINGTVVNSNPDTFSDVIGDTATNASGNEVMTFANVVVQ